MQVPFVVLIKVIRALNQENPYSSPLHDQQTDEPADQQLGRIARTTFLAWEKLRILYNVVLVFLTLVAAAKSVWTLSLLTMAVAGAVFANLCYFAGPIIETYVTWLGYRGKQLRVWLFISGTLFACGLAYAVVVTLP